MNCQLPNSTDKDVPSNESQGARLPRDRAIWDRLVNVIEENGHSSKHVLELFPAYARRLHMGRFLAHYELFKNVIDLPGCVVELGVYRGSSFLTWTKLMETFCPGDRKRMVFGFDSFEGLQNLTSQDGKPVDLYGKTAGGYSAKNVAEEVTELIDICNEDSMVPGVPRCQLIMGDIKDSLPKFLEENPGLRISLLHFDMDLYEPTKTGLELLYPLVVRGGVVVFDEYGIIPWQGESNAVDEYFESIGERPVLRKFPFSTQPHGYFIK